MPVTDAADALFAALDANQAITLTGEASQGYGVEVEGEVHGAGRHAFGDSGCCRHPGRDGSRRAGPRRAGRDARRHRGNHGRAGHLHPTGGLNRT